VRETLRVQDQVFAYRLFAFHGFDSAFRGILKAPIENPFCGPPFDVRCISTIAFRPRACVGFLLPVTSGRSKERTHRDPALDKRRHSWPFSRIHVRVPKEHPASC
jgi:hypothetical protein